MHRRALMLSAAASLIAAPLSQALAQAAPNSMYPPPRYTNEPPFRLAVGAIDIVDRDPSPMRPPRVEQLFPLTPARAIRIWAHDRLVAVGGPARLVVTILKARARDTVLRQEEGTLSRAATDQLSDRYDLEAEVRVDAVEPSGRTMASARAVATRYQTVLESTSPMQRDGIWYDMVRELMTSLVPELDHQIRAHFTAYLR